jgi:uncharacterized membrane protein YcaP (DUF421 family)
VIKLQHINKKTEVKFMYSYIKSLLFDIDWNSMVSPSVSILEKIIRALFIYFFLIFGLRIFGKRELAQLNPFDIIVLFLLSNTVQNSLIGNDNSLVGGIIGAGVLFAINYIVIKFDYDNKKVANVLEGSSDVLIENGIVKLDKLKNELISLDELEMAAHKDGFGSLDEIERAEIDPDGAITFIAKKTDPEEKYYKELLAKIDSLTEDVKSLKRQIERK